MRFMVMHKVDANMEAGGPPSQEIIRDMGALVQQSLKDGVFITGAGLHPSSKRARVNRGNETTHVTRGPYKGNNELLASFAMVRAQSMDEAILLARQLAEASGDANVEVGPVVEPWDLGLMEKPPLAPQRFLLLSKADGAFERGSAPSPSHVAALKELQEADKLLESGMLKPSSKGSRRAAPGKGQQTWVDGPFTESKELIAGFSILNVPSKEAAIAWADRYVAILSLNEVDVRELVET